MNRKKLNETDEKLLLKNDCLDNLTINEFNELTDLANLMLEPESNFDKLKYIWKNENKFRILYGGLNDI